ncbi:MAG: Gfo/Idh/MocA family oxidoreductase [Pirellulaceae bacterium]|nr:Gfo/Idh/MocA family oxidoreductase [Pirellulaceae bacterium]
MSRPSNDRRSFLVHTAGTAAALSVPYYFSSPRTLADETKSKNNRLALGLIGAGGMGMGNMEAAKEWVDVVAIADVDSTRRESANAKLSQGKADMYGDYRKILERKDIDVVHIATPDHWHTKPLIEAMLAGKDVYCEKPLTLTIDEGKLIRKIQKQTGRIVQVGTQQRSSFNLFAKAMAIVQDGRLGKIVRVQAAIGAAPTSPSIPIADVPANLDWDRWLGPAPKVDYRTSQPQSKEGVSEKKNAKKNANKDPRPLTNGHYEFRWWYEYSGGKLTDWGAHHVDIATWALQLNGQTAGPLSVGGTAVHPVEFKDGMPVLRDRYNTATSFLFNVAFPGGTEMVIRNDTDNGVLIEGEKGKLFVNRGKLTGAPVDALKDSPLPEDAIQRVYKGLPMESNDRKAHWACFLNCVRSRKEPISDVHSHMQMLNTCHLAGISARLGRTVKWDAANEQIVGDEQANAMLKRPYRAGYEIEM